VDGPVHPAGTERAVSALSGGGVRLLVNLHQRPYDPDRLERHGRKEVHLPVKDFAALSPEQIGRGVGAILETLAAGEAAAVHCGGGLGRTGTVLACYLEIDEGLGPEEAVRRVRALRPGSVQTPAQLAAIPSVGRALGPLKGSGYGKTLLVEPGSLRLARDEAS
jgi:atypical dual specificity phosphatase